MAGSPGCVHALVKYPDCREAQDQWGQRPLHKSPEKYAGRVIRILLKAGCDIEARDGFGNTPQHSMAKMGNLEAVIALSAKGADLTAHNDKHQTPVDCANSMGYHRLADIVADIIESKAFWENPPGLYPGKPHKKPAKNHEAAIKPKAPPQPKPRVKAKPASSTQKHIERVMQQKAMLEQYAAPDDTEFARTPARERVTR